MASDHLLPLDELGLDVVAELIGRRGKAFEADILEFRLHLRAVDDLAQRAVELGDDVGRRAGRRDEAGPGVEVEALRGRLRPWSADPGNSDERLMRDTASARSVPAATCGMAW